MALTPCPDCSQDVSSEALACPHCGYKPRPVISVGGLLVLWIVCAAGAFIPGGIFWSIMGAPGGEGGAFVMIAGLGAVLAFLIVRGRNAVVR